MRLLVRRVWKTIVPIFVLFCFLFLVVARKMASIHLILMSLFRNIGHLNFFEDLGRRKLSLRKCKLLFTTGNYSCLSFSETLQRPLWNVSREAGMPHPPFPQPSVLGSSQLHQNEGLPESDPDCSTCPTPCHRLHDHTFDFSRTRNVHSGSEGTWNSL